MHTPRFAHPALTHAHPFPPPAPVCSKVRVSVGEVSKTTERSKMALLHRRDPVFNEG